MNAAVENIQQLMIQVNDTDTNVCMRLTNLFVVGSTRSQEITAGYGIYRL